MHRILKSTPLLALLFASVGQGEYDDIAKKSASLTTGIQESFETDAALQGHTFDHIYEEGFDCTRILTPVTDLVAYAATLPAGSNVVCLKPGTYVLNARLAIPSDTLLQGMGQGPNRSSATLFLASGVDSEAIRIAGKQRVSLKHLKVDGNGANQSNSPNPPGIAIAQSSDIHIEDVEITRTSRMAIVSSQTARVHVNNSLIRNMDESNEQDAIGAIWVANGSQSIWIGDNHIIGRNNGPGGDGGVDCYDTDDINIYRNTIVDTGESSIYAGSPGCTNVSIWANDIHNSHEFAIDITLGSEHVFVGSNYINGTAVAAMVFWQVNDVIVQHNTMQNGHAFPPYVPCKSIVLDAVTNVSIDNTNYVDGGPLYCLR